MISTGKQAIIVGLLVAAIFLNKAASFAINCEDPAYLADMKDQVRPFYTIEPLSELHQHGPCSHADGNQIARLRLPVHTLEPEDAAMSTCPWTYHIDVDPTGYRFPCRIVTAQLIWDNSEDGEDESSAQLDSLRRSRCLRVPGSRHHRSDNKVCKNLVQEVPTVIRTGCATYTIVNTTVTVGFTCTFV